MGKKHQLNGRAKTEKIHGNRGQNKGRIHFPLFQGLLNKVPVRHAPGVQLKMLGRKLFFLDKIL